MRVLFLAAGLLVSGVSFAQSILVVEDHVVVTEIDGQKISSGFFSAPSKRFELPAGQHAVTAMYKRLYDLNADNHDVLRSAELTVTSNFQDGQTYGLKMASQPSSYDDAKEYAKKPTLQLVHGSQVLASKTAITGTSTGLLGGVAKSIGGLFDGNGDNTVVIDTTPAAGVSSAPSNAQTVAQQRPAAAVRATSNSVSTLDRFMQVWLQATPAEREKIRHWVKDQ